MAVIVYNLNYFRIWSYFTLIGKYTERNHQLYVFTIKAEKNMFFIFIPRPTCIKSTERLAAAYKFH